MAKLGGIERRLFRAVLIVLAGGCHPPATEPARPQPPITEAQPIEIVETSYAEPSPASAPPPATSDAERDPAQFCAAYKQATRVDASRVPTAIEHAGDLDGGDFIETARWNGRQQVAQCQIIRDTQWKTVRIVHAPQCCRSKNCGKPTTLDVRTRRLLVETLQLRPDGTVADTKLAWIAEQPMQERRHNCGRRPEGWVDDATADGTGAELAAMAELEAASIPAFERLARELAHHGAPARMVRRARAAMRDEIRHARTMTALARSYGAEPRAIDVPALPVRSLAEIARENAIEGCVREAYGALIATHQAACAAPELRDAFARIAVDERRHAALAEEVHAWLTLQLDRVTCDELARARSDAQVELRGQLVTAPSNDVLGLPPPARAIALFDAYFS
jgi:hypothetical protein